MFSIIVPTYRRPNELAGMLAALERAIAEVPGRVEVIVTSDAGDDESRVIVERLGHRWTTGQRRGPAANRNHGVALATCEWLVFLDDDCLPKPELLTEYRSVIEANPRAQVVEGAIVAVGKRNAWNLEAVENISGGVLWSCNFAIRRQFYHQLGGFDESFAEASGEDIDLRNRILSSGAKIPFAQKAVVEHPARYLTIGQMWRQTLRARWGVLVELRRKPSGFFPRGLAPVVTFPLFWARCLRQFVRDARSDRFLSHRAARLAVNLVLAPLIIPYLIFWEWRFRSQPPRLDARQPKETRNVQ
jgi:GT2 family glycosyltransferase